MKPMLLLSCTACPCTCKEGVSHRLTASLQRVEGCHALPLPRRGALAGLTSGQRVRGRLSVCPRQGHCIPLLLICDFLRCCRSSCPLL